MPARRSWLASAGVRLRLAGSLEACKSGERTPHRRQMNSKKKNEIRNSRPSKRLIFDRRYGWVFDEWSNPSEVALSGGRGRFCILPLVKALVEITSQSVNYTAGSIVKALETPDKFSPQALKTNLNDQFQKLMSSIQRPNPDPLSVKGNTSILSTSLFQHVHPENGDLENR